MIKKLDISKFRKSAGIREGRFVQALWMLFNKQEELIDWTREHEGYKTRRMLIDELNRVNRGQCEIVEPEPKPDPNCYQCMHPDCKGIHTCKALRPKPDKLQELRKRVNAIYDDFNCPQNCSGRLYLLEKISQLEEEG